MEKKIKKVYIETLGCQMNKSDSERILAILSHFNYEETLEPKEADLLIVNTCSIRQLSEEKAYSRLGVWGKWKTQEGKKIKIALCGCLPQHTKENLMARFPYLDLAFGTQNIYELPNLIDKINNDERIWAIRNSYVPEKDYGYIRRKDVNAWLPITEGCNNFCSYCIVPFTRGREHSRDFDTIVKEAKEIVSQGFKEITLLGQNVDSYGKDLEGKPTLAALLREIDKIEGKFRIRFVTSYPTDITDELIETVANSEKISRYFHIPMQSGDTRILKKMNRRYTREEYGDIVRRIREKIPEVIVTSDFIVGFPSETEEEFERTLTAIDEFGINYSNIASYSPRPHTKAAKMVDEFISEEEKDRRFQILNDKVKETSLKNHKACVGKVFEVLIDSKKEDECKARTTCNKIVYFKSNKNIGDFAQVKITSADTWHLKAEEV